MTLDTHRQLTLWGAGLFYLGGMGAFVLLDFEGFQEIIATSIKFILAPAAVAGAILVALAHLGPVEDE